MRGLATEGCAALCAATISVLTSVLTTVAAWAACPSDDAVKALAANVLAAVASEPLAVTSMEDGLCAQEKLLAILEKRWGKPIGYKAALTSEAAQSNFGVREPVRGVLLADMMLKNGAKLPAKFGALPRYEADLILIVADADINKAKTIKEVLAHLASVHPFIELPDLVVDAPSKLNGPVIASINAGARYGIVGEALPVEQTDAFLAALADMKVTITGQNGEQLAIAQGSAVLGHPLNAVLWLRDSGVTFKAGDMISVGSIGPLLPPKSGLTATVTYHGLPGNPAIRVSFE